MILGVGIDIIEVKRVENARAKFGSRFLARILRPNEIAYCVGNSVPGPVLAGRFAAKEAVAKALGARIGSALGWQDIEIMRDTSGAPIVVLFGKGRSLLDSRGARKVHLSLSHTQNYAAAVAVVEG